MQSLFRLLIITSFLYNHTLAQLYTSCKKPNDILFTFDDVPDSGSNVNKIRNILNKYSIKGLFFVNGAFIKLYNKEKIMAQLLSDGHILGSHTFSHASLSKVNEYKFYSELFFNDYLFKELWNIKPKYFRPPYFDYNSEMLLKFTSLGYKLITADLNPQDWYLKNGTAIFEYIQNQIDIIENKILLLHAQVDESVIVLERIIKFIKIKGYNIVSPSECFQEESYSSIY